MEYKQLNMFDKPSKERNFMEEWQKIEYSPEWEQEQIMEYKQLSLFDEQESRGFYGVADD